jgi:hypothetical protein
VSRLSIRKAEQARRVFDEKLVLNSRIRRVERDEIDQIAVIGHDRHVRVRPVRSPQDAIRRRIDQGLAERSDIVKGRSRA